MEVYDSFEGKEALTMEDIGNRAQGQHCHQPRVLLRALHGLRRPKCRVCIQRTSVK